MLDMAFQLLTFFIPTFRPAPIEGQISMRLPPPQGAAVVKDGQKPGGDLDNRNPVQGVNTLTISVFADPKVVRDPGETAAQVAPLLGLPPAEVLENR